MSLVGNQLTRSTDATAQAYEAASQLGATGRSDIVGHTTGSDFRSVS